MSSASLSTSILCAGLFVPALFGLAGCDESTTTQQSTTSQADTSSSTVHDFCANDTRAQTFVPGMVAQGQLVKATLRESSPTPPRMGKTIFTVAFTDADGLPIEDLEASVRTFMPDHKHGSPSDASANAAPDPSGEPGLYTIGVVDFFMAQYWEVTFNLRRTSNTSWSDSVLFTFCIEP